MEAQRGDPARQRAPALLRRERRGRGAGNRAAARRRRDGRDGLLARLRVAGNDRDRRGRPEPQQVPQLLPGHRWELAAPGLGRPALVGGRAGAPLVEL